MSRRGRAIHELGHRISLIDSDHPIRVAIDGVTTAGKTTLAAELAVFLGQSSPVTRLSVDDYHRPPEERYRRGRDSPEGYYHDAFDYPKFLVALQDTKATGILSFS